MPYPPAPSSLIRTDAEARIYHLICSTFSAVTRKASGLLSRR